MKGGDLAEGGGMVVGVLSVSGSGDLVLLVVVMGAAGAKSMALSKTQTSLNMEN